MEEVAKLLNAMVADGIVSDYAVFGAVAQMRYTEAVATLDAGILVTVPDADRIDALTPIYEYCAERGYTAEGEAIRVGSWPVQVIPVFDAVTKAAIAEAETGDIDGVPLRVVTPEYLALIALSVGRPKDFARILALLENDAVSRHAIATLSARNGLSSDWEHFEARYLDD